jgi:hypothetical protein
MKVETVQNSFVGGEFAPALLGRTDIAQYANACSTIENLLVRPNGAAKSTPGTEYINDARYSTVTYSGAYISDANTLLLLHLDGAEGATTFTDSSSYTNSCLVLSTSTTSITTANYKFGSGSVKIKDFTESGVDGTLLVYDSASGIFNLNKDLTIECRVRINKYEDTPSALGLFNIGGTYPGSTDTIFLGLYGGVSSGSYYAHAYFKSGGSSNDFFSSAITLNLDTWYHIVFTFTNTTKNIKAYINGVNVLNKTVVYLPDFSAGSSFKLAYNGSVRFSGNIDEYRISNLIRWGSDFNPPTNSTSNIYGKSKLNPFIFSRTDSYVIETGENYFRFYTNGGVVNT